MREISDICCQVNCRLCPHRRPKTTRSAAQFFLFTTDTFVLQLTWSEEKIVCRSSACAVTALAATFAIFAQCIRSLSALCSAALRAEGLFHLITDLVFLSPIRLQPALPRRRCTATAPALCRATCMTLLPRGLCRCTATTPALCRATCTTVSSPHRSARKSINPSEQHNVKTRMASLGNCY